MGLEDGWDVYGGCLWDLGAMAVVGPGKERRSSLSWARPHPAPFVPTPSTPPRLAAWAGKRLRGLDAARKGVVPGASEQLLAWVGFLTKP